MAISGNVPKHLLVAARTGFLEAAGAQTFPWRRVAQEFNMTAKSQDLVDLGEAPMPKESKTGVTVQDMVEKSKVLTVQNWDVTVGVSQDALDDDQTGTLDGKFRGAGRNFQKHINKIVFSALNGGDGTTYGLCYDGQEFFDSDHVDPGANYQTAQDNEYALALSLDNFNSVWTAAQAVRDDQGEFAEYQYNLLVCHPTSRVLAANITGNVQAMDTANREVNPFANEIDYITSPYLDTTAWHLIAEGEEVKPMIVAMRREPSLQHAWFDASKPDGGMHYFKFYGRYSVHYGQWRLAFQGNT